MEAEKDYHKYFRKKQNNSAFNFSYMQLKCITDISNDVHFAYKFLCDFIQQNTRSTSVQLLLMAYILHINIFAVSSTRCRYQLIPKFWRSVPTSDKNVYKNKERNLLPTTKIKKQNSSLESSRRAGGRIGSLHRNSKEKPCPS